MWAEYKGYTWSHDEYTQLTIVNEDEFEYIIR